MVQFVHHPLRLLNPSFDSPLLDVLTDLEHLRRLQIQGTTPLPVFMQLKQVFHVLESLASARIEGNHTTLANNTTLAGHVHLGDWVTVGGLTGIHQFVKVGAHAMVGFASAVSQDVPPFMLVDGNPLAVRGYNVVGLRRRGFSPERIAAVKQMHKLIYRQGLTLEAARAAIAELVQSSPQASEDAAMMERFLADATRGIAR